MMRIHFLFLIFIFPVFLMAQESDTIGESIVPVDEVTELIAYKDVVESEGTQQELFKRAVKWISDYYKNAASVTTRRDFESGVIEGNHRFKIYNSSDDGVNVESGTILYDFTLEFREGRYRYTYTNFALKGTSKTLLERWLDKDDPSFSEYNLTQLRKVDEHMQGLIAELIEAMQPPKEVVEEDW